MKALHLRKNHKIFNKKLLFSKLIFNNFLYVNTQNLRTPSTSSFIYNTTDSLHPLPFHSIGFILKIAIWTPQPKIGEKIIKKKREQDTQPSSKTLIKQNSLQFFVNIFFVRPLHAEMLHIFPVKEKKSEMKSHVHFRPYIHAYIKKTSHSFRLRVVSV